METGFLLACAGSGLGLLAIGCSGAVISRVKGLGRRTAEQAALVETQLATLRKELDEVTLRAKEQALRLAWLESRVRNGAAAAPGGKPAAEAPRQPERTNINERRHQVLSLARRGVDVEGISQTLGMPQGEIELIIGLSRVGSVTE